VILDPQIKEIAAQKQELSEQRFRIEDHKSHLVDVRKDLKDVENKCAVSDNQVRQLILESEQLRRQLAAEKKSRSQVSVAT
jgi:hypothetical protein